MPRWGTLGVVIAHRQSSQFFFRALFVLTRVAM